MSKKPSEIIIPEMGNRDSSVGLPFTIKLHYAVGAIVKYLDTEWEKKQKALEIFNDEMRADCDACHGQGKEHSQNCLLLQKIEPLLQ